MISNILLIVGVLVFVGIIGMLFDLLIGRKRGPFYCAMCKEFIPALSDEFIVKDFNGNYFCGYLCKGMYKSKKKLGGKKND